MMDISDEAELRMGAARAIDQAQRARELAVAIERRRHELSGRLDPVRRLHTPAVWSAAAATASRVTLERVVARHVWEVTNELSAIASALLRRAVEFDEEARSALRRADLVGHQPSAANAERCDC